MRVMKKQREKDGEKEREEGEMETKCTNEASK